MCVQRERAEGDSDGFLFNWVWAPNFLISVPAAKATPNVLKGLVSMDFFEFDHVIQPLSLTRALGPSDGPAISVGLLIWWCDCYDTLESLCWGQVEKLIYKV